MPTRTDPGDPLARWPSSLPPRTARCSMAGTARPRRSPCGSCWTWRRVWEAERLIDVDVRPHRQLPVPRSGRAGLRRAAARPAARASHPDHAQRLLARSAPSRPRSPRRRDVDAGAEADGCLRRHGLPTHVDVRPVSARTAPGVRRARRVGRVERDRLRELGAGRAHEPLRRLHRHLRGDHRTGAGRRPASRRAAARQRRVPAGGRRAGTPAPRRDHAHMRRTHRGPRAPGRTCPSSSGSPPTRTRIG